VHPSKEHFQVAQVTCLGSLSQIRTKAKLTYITFPYFGNRHSTTKLIFQHVQMPMIVVFGLRICLAPHFNKLVGGFMQWNIFSL
jgi:hypothetical protein